MSAPSTPSLPPPGAVAMLSGVPSLDSTFSFSQPQSDQGLGLPPGQALEILGPTASGKTRLGLEILINNRIAGLSISSKWAEQLQDRRHAKRKRSWEVATDGENEGDYNQTLIIDTEGSLTPALIVEVVRQQVRLLTFQSPVKEEDFYEDVLQGIHLIRPTSLPELIATLRILTTSPTSPCSTATSSSSSPASSPPEGGVRGGGDDLPPISHLSSILLDSLSYHLRTPLETSSEKRARRHALALLSTLVARLVRLNARIRVVGTGQMSLKMFTRAGELVNYRTPGSIARMVPQLDVYPPLDPHGPDAGHAGYDHTSRPWTEVVTPPSLDGNRWHSKGVGILGENAWRILLFRVGEKRVAQVIHAPSPPIHHTEEDKVSMTLQGEPASSRETQNEVGKWIQFHFDDFGRIVE